MNARVAWTPKQLALFEAGKLPRGKRRAPAPEVKTCIAFADMLRKLALPDWWWSHVPSGELRTESTGALLKRMGLRPGMGDYLFIGPAGDHRWLEFKRGKLGRLSPDQLEFAGMCHARNVPHAVARSFAEGEAIVRDWGVLRPEARGIG